MNDFSTYSNNSKNVCIYITISIILILIFIISPLNKYFISSLIGKIVALLILGYALYENYMNTISFSKNTNVSIFTGSMDNIKMNIIGSNVFSFFILLLFFSLVKNLIM